MKKCCQVTQVFNDINVRAPVKERQRERERDDRGQREEYLCASVHLCKSVSTFK
jgi:hypothetical protein